MHEYLNLRYDVTVSALVSLPYSEIGKNARPSDVISWDTAALLKMIFPEVDESFRKRKESEFRVKRIQDKMDRWLVMDLTFVSTERLGKKLRISLCDPKFRKDFEAKERVARTIGERISPILYSIDPMGLKGAPRDEYDPEAYYIAEKISIGEDKLSTQLVKDVFEQMFMPGCCSEDTYQQIVKTIELMINERRDESSNAS